MGIGDRSGEAAGYLHLGVIYIRCGEYDKAEKYLMPLPLQFTWKLARKKEL